MLTRVTITGADDNVDPTNLAALSLEFPFVEWGILFSSKRTGEPRYPSASWTKRLLDLHHETPMQLSAHLCGDIARRVNGGLSSPITALSGDFDRCPFQRIQINGFRPPAHDFISMAQTFPAIEFILQAGNERALHAATGIAAQIDGASVLFDPSGGRGIPAEKWPNAPSWMPLGYAGGIGASTVNKVLYEIPRTHEWKLNSFWIDMESLMRLDDQLWLPLVVATLTESKRMIDQYTKLAERTP